MTSESPASGRHVPDKAFHGLFPETRIVSFNRRQDRLLFFSIVDELVGRDDIGPRRRSSPGGIGFASMAGHPASARPAGGS